MKEEHDGTKRYKARMVVKVLTLPRFSPVVKLTTIRSVRNIVLSIVTVEDLL